MAHSPLLNTLFALGYDSSIYELSPQVPPTTEPWVKSDLLAVLAQRAAWQKRQRELHVYYYRINQTIAYPLPVCTRPASLPAGIPKRSWYPWLIWLLWTLEERWRTLHAAWRMLDDEEAGLLLQQELAALNQWQSFTNWNNEVGLPTGHLAACLAYFLRDDAGWMATHYAAARAAAERLVVQDLWPWFQTAWAQKSDLSPHDIHNIPVIALVRGAQLARAVNSPHADVLEAKATETLRAWWRYRFDAAAPHTEGVSYDGYLMDSFTEWLDGAPDRTALLAEGRAAFADLARQWVYSTLPGRFDLHAPLSDVEPEMPFWMNCLLRMVQWYGVDARTATDDIWAESRWLLPRIPAVRLPAAALTLALTNAASAHTSIEASTDADLGAPPSIAPQTVANAITLRSGWTSADLLALVGLSRSEMSHLHNDGGHLILGWQRRFWITDPGYQQYRPGAERDFTIGMAAHNAPVIGEIFQSRRGVQLLDLTTVAPGRYRVALDLTRCYEGLAEAAGVQRTIYFEAHGPQKGPLILVRDTLSGLAAGTLIHTHWLAGAHLAWSFVDGWARLSDGDHALWIGTLPGEIDAMMMERHDGSRGPLTLVHQAPTTADGCRWWIFCTDPELGWTPPRLSQISWPPMET